MGKTVFHIRYQNWGTLQSEYRQQICRRGLFLRTREQPQQFTAVLLRLFTPEREVFELPGEVVQVISGQGLAVQFAAEVAGTIERLKERCAAQPTGQPGEAGAKDPQVTLADAAGGTGETPEGIPTGVAQPARAEPTPAGDSQNLQRQVEQMSVDEKRRTALHGRKDMRMLLIRDRNKTIHPFVLKNPAITLDEIEQIAKMPSVNPEALRMIATNLEWARSISVCRNLIHNPKTPLREALHLLGKLPPSEIRALAKSGNVRTAIQQAARKTVLG